MVLYKKNHLLIYVDNINQRFFTKKLTNLHGQYRPTVLNKEHSLQEDMLNSPIKHLL